MVIEVEPHPHLDVRIFATRFPAPVASHPAHPDFQALLADDPTLPLQTDDTVRKAVRDLLRHGGYRPTGRGKPAAEYLLKARAEGRFPRINPAVDLLNLVSLHSGLPISVVDQDLAKAPFSIAVVPDAQSYVFNPGGQEIGLQGLLCLHDAAGPCANAVKDAQRTKTRPETQHTLSVLWGTHALPGRAEAACAWYRSLLEATGATTEPVPITVNG